MKISELTPEQIKDIESKCDKVPCTCQEAVAGPKFYTCISYSSFSKIFEEQYKDLPSPIRSEE